MRCFACDILLENPTPDKPTGRVYCEPCFAFTIEEQLRISEGDLYTVIQDIDLENNKTEEEEFDYELSDQAF